MLGLTLHVLWEVCTVQFISGRSCGPHRRKLLTFHGLLWTHFSRCSGQFCMRLPDAAVRFPYKHAPLIGVPHALLKRPGSMYVPYKQPVGVGYLASARNCRGLPHLTQAQIWGRELIDGEVE